MLKKICKKMFKAIIISIGIICGIIVLGWFGWQRHCDSPLNQILSETEEIPAYVLWGEVYSGGTVTDVDWLCYENGYLLEEIFCVKDEKVYFACKVPYRDDDCWAIGTIDLVTSEIQIHYKLAESFGKSYERAIVSDYKDRDGYYYNGEIVLNAQETVLVYDIDADEVQKYDYNDYEFPERSVYGECIDNHTIVLHVEDTVREYSLQNMATQSEGISKLFALKDRKIHNGDSYIDNLFSNHNSVQCIEDKIYVIGRCLNYLGDSGAVILEYDIENDRWIYVTGKHIPLGDDIHWNCYVIPQITHKDSKDRQ